MPLNISNLGKILKTLNRVSLPAEFNATLPVKIEIKKELNPITYLIKLGNRELETKSKVPLKEGMKYFAQIHENAQTLQIRNLKPYPEVLDILQKTPLKKGFFGFKKDEVIQHLTNAKNRNEFLFFANIWLAMQKNIRHFAINEEKKALMQYKYSKNRISFYAVFQNLGELDGEITQNSVKICSEYDNVLKLLKNYENEIDLKLHICLKKPKALYVFTDKLLDLKA